MWQCEQCNSEESVDFGLYLNLNVCCICDMQFLMFRVVSEKYQFPNVKVLILRISNTVWG